MIYLLVSLILSFSAFSAERVELLFSSPEVKQGAIVSARLKADGNAVQSLDFQKLKGQTVGKVIYFYNISPLMKKDGETSYEADAKVIFVTPPESSFVQDNLQGKEIQLKWNQVKVLPVEAEKNFLFAQFDVSWPKSFLAWFLWGLGAIIVAFLSLVGFKKYQLKKSIKEKKQKLKKEIFDAASFDEVVSVWKKKRLYVAEFPHIEEPFSILEQTLFKYQFKQHQSEVEKEKVIEAYRTFLNAIQGGFNGI